MTDTTNEINIGRQRPAPLDNTKLHSPEVRRRWHAAEQAYWASVNASSREAERKAEVERAYGNRVLDDQEYYEMAVARENESRARDRERQAAAFAKEQEQTAFMASTPETVTVLENNPTAMMQKIEHWLAKSYVVDYSTPVLCLPPALFTCTLKRGAKPAKKAVAA